jgi:pimeloyl-ACP methyl ester carboxylesterase
MNPIPRILPFTLLLCTLHAQPKGIEGEWQGALQAGPLKMRLGLHVEKDATGAFSSKLDSIDQGSKQLPVQTTTFAKGHLHLDIPSIHATYDGDLNDAGSEIHGTFTQGAAILLTFARVDKIAELVRPQNPKPPFPYDATDVAYENHGIKLAGTLTTPRGAGPFPAAVLITGSGPEDRDETLMGHKPFLVIADYLTRRGIAILRLDDRGVGQSTGDSSKTTIQEMATDVLTGVAFLKSRKEIDPKHIGLIGHSEGGIVGPMAASQSPDIAFVVMLAGTGVSGEQVLYLQAELVARSMGAMDAGIAQNRKTQEMMFNAMRSEANNPDTEAVIAKLRQAWKDAYHSDPPKPIEAQFAGVASPELRSFLFYDPAPALRKLKIPVLALNGSRDIQVPPAQNLPAIVAALAAGGNPDFEAVEIPGLNHLFQHCKTCAPSEYGELEETFAPEALEVMADWLSRHTRK